MTLFLMLAKLACRVTVVRTDDDSDVALIPFIPIPMTLPTRPTVMMMMMMMMMMVQ